MDESKILELEQRISRLEGWKESTQSLLETIKKDIDDLKNRITFLDRKIDEKFLALDQKVNRFFIWMIGIQFGILLSIIMLLMRMTL